MANTQDYKSNQIAKIPGKNKLIALYDKLKTAPASRYAQMHADRDDIGEFRQTSLTLEKIIYPFLLKDMPETREEKIERLRLRKVPEDEIEEIMEDFEDQVVARGDLYPYGFVLDWGDLFDGAKICDNVTEGLARDIGMGRDEIREAAIANLARKRVRMLNLHELYPAAVPFDIYRLDYESETLPSYNVSMLLIKKLWDRMAKICGSEYYIMPFARHFVLVLPRREINRGAVTKNALQFLIENEMAGKHAYFDNDPVIYENGELRKPQGKIYSLSIKW